MFIAEFLTDYGVTFAGPFTSSHEAASQIEATAPSFSKFPVNCTREHRQEDCRSVIVKHEVSFGKDGSQKAWIHLTTVSIRKVIEIDKIQFKAGKSGH